MIGVDLGTTNVRIHVKGKGVMLREPAVIAIVHDTQEVKAVGDDAYRMVGRTPDNIIAVRPMAGGVIADYSLTEKMLRAFIRKIVTGPTRLFKPNIMVCIPSGITEVEKRAVLQAMNELGARRSFLIEEPVAAAIGAGINVAEPTGSMVIDIGGGTTDVAVISLGGSVVSESLRVAGNTFDADIIRYVRAKENLLIGERTAEEIKIKIGAAVLLESDPTQNAETQGLETQGLEAQSLEVRGRDLISGMPRTITVTSQDTVEALKSSTQAIIAAVRKVLERTPPELLSDVIERGIIMTGGGALLTNLAALIQADVHIPVMTADNATDCVVLGTSQALEMVKVLKDALNSNTLQRYAQRYA